MADVDRDDRAFSFRLQLQEAVTSVEAVRCCRCGVGVDDVPKLSLCSYRVV